MLNARWRGIIPAHEASSPVGVQRRGGAVDGAVCGDMRAVGAELFCSGGLRLVRRYSSRWGEVG